MYRVCTHILLCVYMCACTCECVSIRAGWGEGLSRGHILTRFLDGAGHSPLCETVGETVSSWGGCQREDREQGLRGTRRGRGSGL